MELRQNNPTDPGYKHNVDKGCLEKLSHTYIVCQGLKDGSVQVRWVVHVCVVVVVGGEVQRGVRVALSWAHFLYCQMA